MAHLKRYRCRHCQKGNLSALETILGKKKKKINNFGNKLLQSIENKFNFNSCLWINVSNHRWNVLGIYDIFFYIVISIFISTIGTLRVEAKASFTVVGTDFLRIFCQRIPFVRFYLIQGSNFEPIFGDVSISLL